MLYRGSLLQTSLTKSLTLVAAVLFAAGMAEAKSENATSKPRFENGQCAAQGACYHSQSAHSGAEHTNDTTSASGDEATAANDDSGHELTSPALDVDQSIADSSASMQQLGQSIHSGEDIKKDVVPGFNPSFDYPVLVSREDDRNPQLISSVGPSQTNWAASFSVPEPATLALLGMGLLVLYMMGQRNKAE